MTQPSPISRFAPNNNDGERIDFIDKKALENVPLVITAARTAKGKNGVFWIVEAVKDGGEAVVFTGSTVIDQTMAAVKESQGFPVAAMLVRHQPEEPGSNWYWMLVDPPSSNGDGAAPSGRIAEVMDFVERGVVTTVDVADMCKDVAGKPAKVNDLDDPQYAELLKRLRAFEAENPVEPPLEDAPF